ncbi:MAG: GDSL-type esterase/lipase family protein [Candidatus Nomurabacteria bacterium]|jgi:lysophospholipase L1-like esterase|nr:GDSL-type esterase/lipase family protein [Candidatus Nomurabacteria bacterium]
MKHILIYGDSNTWGSTAFAQGTDDTERLPEEKRWSNILAQRLGREWTVTAEGLCGRVAGDFATEDDNLSGQKHYDVALASAAPVDLVIIALGTNDLNRRYGRELGRIVDDILWYEGHTHLVDGYNFSKMPAMLFVLPPNFVPTVGYFDGDAELRLKLNAKLKTKLANWLEISDLDLSSDGVHIAESGHVMLANKVYEKLLEMMQSL